VAARIPKIFSSLVEQHQPDAILSLGEARGSPHIRVERRAVNRLRFVGDNSGAGAVDQPVVAGGSTEYRSTLCDMVDRAIRFMGIPCELSDSAGTFCCNQILYLSLRHGVRNQPRLLAGFIHLPSLPEQRVSGVPMGCHLPLQSQVGAVRAALRMTAHLCTGF
jgi:pyroglutamyl-peptidase